MKGPTSYGEQVFSEEDFQQIDNNTQAVSNKYSDFLAVNQNNILNNESKKLQEQK